MDYKDTVSILAWLSCYQKYPLQYTYLFCNFWTNIKIEFIFQPLFPPFFEVVGKHFIWHEIKTFSFRNKKLRKSFSFYSSWVLKTRRSCCMMAGFYDKWNIFVGKYSMMNFGIFNLFFYFFLISEYVWSQEEHQNAGPWSFIKPRFENLLGIRNLKYVGRGPLCQPAVGVGVVHQQEVGQLFRDTFK